MKNLIFILFALVAAENNSSGMHDSKAPILHVASCYPGMIWCRDPPYNYRCDTTSNLVQDRVHNVCEDNCSCRWMQSRSEGPSATETVAIVARPQTSHLIQDRVHNVCEDNCSCRWMQSCSDGPLVTETVAIVARPQDPCEMRCAWGHGWCQSRPYNYRCDGSGRLLRDKGHDGCDHSCWCGCEESLPEASLWDPVGKVEL